MTLEELRRRSVAARAFGAYLTFSHEAARLWTLPPRRKFRYKKSPRHQIGEQFDCFA